MYCIQALKKVLLSPILGLIFAFSLIFFMGTPYAATKTSSPPSPKLKVLLEGLSKEDQALIVPGLSIKAAEKEKKLNEERIESLHQIALQELTNILESLGYYHATIHSDLKHTQTGFVAVYNVEKGRPTRIRNVIVKVIGSGAELKELQNLSNHPPLQPGMILTHSSYENFKHALLGKALQQGYLDAIFEINQVRINRETYTADIHLRLNTGKQYKIGEIRFQPGPYPESYLQKHIPFKQGEPFTVENLAAFQKNLNDTDLFKKIRIDPNIDEAEDYTIPLKIRLSPRPKNKFTGSVGYGTDSR